MGWKTFIDISKWQGAVDFGVLKASGVDALYMRAYQGKKRDERLDEYAAGARAHGIPFGLYTYWRPKYTVVEQLDLLCGAHVNLGASLIPMLDIEHGDEKDPRFIGQQVNEAVAGVEHRLGMTPVIYTAAWFWNPAVVGAEVSRCPLWLARYSVPNPVPPNPSEWADYALRYAQPAMPNGGWSRWSAWQFSADGNHMAATYGASSSHLDLNILRDEDWARFQTARPAPPAPPIHEHEEIEMRLVTPVRLYDSRNVASFGKGESREIAVGSVSAAFVNLTVVDPAGDGFLTAWAGTSTPPNVSNVNFSKGDAIANSAWVPVEDGKIRVYVSAPAHVLVDLQAVA
jgi:GH25 family lysozyme M1 (1,4-beta-N-acetylmuramidase)